MADQRTRKKIGKGRHHSALKRARQNEKRRERNQMAMSALRTFIKNVKAKPTKAALSKAIPKIDKAANKGIIPKERAARIISRLTKSVNATASA